MKRRKKKRGEYVVTDSVTTTYWSIFPSGILNETVEKDDKASIVKYARNDNDSNNSNEGSYCDLKKSAFQVDGDKDEYYMSPHADLVDDEKKSSFLNED